MSAPRVSVGEAQAQVRAAVRLRPVVEIPTFDAAGRVLARSLHAARRLPTCDDSAMDGYAVRAAEVVAERRFIVDGETAAGNAEVLALPAGAARRIFTGAALPPGADAVVMQEDSRRDGAGVYFNPKPRSPALSLVLPFENVRRAGSDVEIGTALLAVGRVLTPGDLSLCGAMGSLTLPVFDRCRVLIVGSGDELIALDAGAPRRGEVVDTNTWALAAAVSLMGHRVTVLPTLGDDRAETERVLTDAVGRCDVLITCGGMSVGDHDHVGPTLRALCGPDFGFWSVAIKPGKPLAFGHAGQAAVFGLPGNPVSALVTFELFVRPYLLGTEGHRHLFRRPCPALVVHDLEPGGGREVYLRATVTGFTDGSGSERLPIVDARRNQSSGALSGLCGADALIRIEVGQAARSAGERVSIIWLTENAESRHG